MWFVMSSGACEAETSIGAMVNGFLRSFLGRNDGKTGLIPQAAFLPIRTIHQKN